MDEMPEPGRPRARSTRTLSAALAAAVLCSCGGGGLSGRYADPRGVTDYDFQPDGHVYISVMGTTTLATYELADGRVLIDGPEGVTVLRQRDDGLEGPLGLRLIRASDDGS